MSTAPHILTTIAGPDGFDTCYVSFKEIVAADGALEATPTVTTEHTDKLTISEAAITFAGSLTYTNEDGDEVTTTFTAGQVLTFKVTAASTHVGLVPIDIEYETPKRKEPLRRWVRMVRWET